MFRSEWMNECKSDEKCPEEKKKTFSSTKRAHFKRNLTTNVTAFPCRDLIEFPSFTLGFPPSRKEWGEGKRSFFEEQKRRRRRWCSLRCERATPRLNELQRVVAKKAPPSLTHAPRNLQKSAMHSAKYFTWVFSVWLTFIKKTQVVRG